MHKKKFYPNTPICLFFTRGTGIDKKITLKLIMQMLLWLYHKDVSSDLTKTKGLFMASISKVAFNIDGLIIHSTLNILFNNIYLVYQTYHQIH
jgi:hypothetical protein